MEKTCKKAIEQLDKIIQLVEQYPNDSSLGGEIRSYIKSIDNTKSRVIIVKERIQYIKNELTMENYWDGFTLKGFREELKELEEELKILNDTSK